MACRLYTVAEGSAIEGMLVVGMQRTRRSFGRKRDIGIQRLSSMM